MQKKWSELKILFCNLSSVTSGLHALVSHARSSFGAASDSSVAYFSAASVATEASCAEFSRSTLLSGQQSTLHATRVKFVELGDVG